MAQLGLMLGLQTVQPGLLAITALALYKYFPDSWSRFGQGNTFG
jgi:hypothetical protein